MTNLSVAVLIPAHNEEATIGELVQAVLGQPRPIQQLIVVADSCKDDTARVAREAGATLVLETNFADKAANQNYALNFINSDVIVGFDGDSKPTPECIGMMVADIEAGYDATCSSILPMQETGFFIEARRFGYSLGSMWWRLCQRQIGRLQVLTGASYAFRTSVVRAVGGFPNGLISADMDITWKLHEHGYKTWYTSNAVTLTIDPETWSGYLSQMHRWSAGYFQNVARYKKLMWNWKSMLVVGSAIWDLTTLWGWSVLVVYNLVTWQHLTMFKYMGWWFLGHTALTVFLVSKVVGWKKALLGFVPYTSMNFVNKYLYTKALLREWVLGKHYTAWTGRTGRPVEISPMTRERKIGLGMVCVGAAGLSLLLWPSMAAEVGTGALVSLGAGMVGVGVTEPKSKKRKNPSRVKDTYAPHKHEETVPLKTLYNPWAETTEELPLPDLGQRVAGDLHE